MRDKLSQVLESLCRDYNDKIFLPILEADVAAYTYHLWISEFGEAINLHLDTRVHQNLDSRFDFVVGKIDYGAGKPCITKPKLVAELKSFPYGFTDQQHRVHYFHVIDDDLPKLKSISNPRDFRYEILFDEDDYLRGNDTKNKSLRIERIIKRRDDLDPKITIVYLRKTAKGLKYKFT
jgi:hypothetical protein